LLQDLPDCFDDFARGVIWRRDSDTKAKCGEVIGDHIGPNAPCGDEIGKLARLGLKQSRLNALVAAPVAALPNFY
jgi:hypothetical protein